MIPQLWAAFVHQPDIQVPCPDEATALAIAALGNSIAALRPDLPDAVARARHHWRTGAWHGTAQEHAAGLPGTLVFWQRLIERKAELETGP